VRLLSHVRGDEDILRAWLSHYRALGITSFHLVVHGPPEDNRLLDSLRGTYPIVIEDRYDDPFDTDEKRRRLNAVLRRLDDSWVVFVDSDEFLEIPVRSLPRAARLIEATGGNVLAAPLIQRISETGSLETPPEITDPMRYFPWWTPDLYRRLGSSADTRKYPLFRREGARLQSGGNHVPPVAGTPTFSRMRAVTHHFKWRRCARGRMTARVESAHRFAHESATYLDYLRRSDDRLPLDGAERYSRADLFRRGMLRAVTAIDVLRHRVRRTRRAVRSLAGRV